jgi:hypothetical protein
MILKPPQKEILLEACNKLLSLTVEDIVISMGDHSCIDHFKYSTSYPHIFEFNVDFHGNVCNSIDISYNNASGEHFDPISIQITFKMNSVRMIAIYANNRFEKYERFINDFQWCRTDTFKDLAKKQEDIYNEQVKKIDWLDITGLKSKCDEIIEQLDLPPCYKFR